MKKSVFILVYMIAFTVLSVNARDKEEDMYRYDIEGVASTSNSDSQIMVKVWSYGKIEKITRELCMRNAVHGVMFKGVPATSGTGVYKGAPAIVPAGYNSDKEYFDRFFESGDYLQYVTLVNHGNVQPGDRIKLSSKEYKVGMECLVNIGALTNRLAEDNKAKRLDSLF